jgi:N-acetylglucosaminyldiphosphoundecaprenol N-acetyl-beta-D-mannosaminyltransferase
MDDIAPSRVTFLGAPLDPLTLEEAVEVVFSGIDGGRQSQHASINAAKVVRLQRDRALRDALWSCDLATADGQPVVWAARLLGIPVPERVAGIDLMEALLARAAERGDGVYLLGARQEVLRAAEEELRRRHSRIRIVGRHHGYFSRDREADVVVGIAAASPQLLFIALETPTKELFLARNRDVLRVPFAMGVGGAFDVLAGQRRRAPPWARRAGLEWLFRLFQEPRRLASRYVVGNSRFVALVAAELVRCPDRGREMRPPLVAGKPNEIEVDAEIGLVAPLPPQVGGVASVAGWLESRQDEIGCRYLTFDLYRPPGAETGGRLTGGSVVRQAGLTFAFLRWSRKAPRLVHYCVAATASGLLRDVFFLALLHHQRAATIAHVHGSDLAEAARSAVRRHALRLLPRLSREIVTIAPSQSLVLRSIGVESRHIFNPIRLDSHRHAEDHIHDVLRLLFVGTYGHRKGAPELVEALAECRRRDVAATLRFVGKEERAGDEEALRRSAARLGIEAQIEFAGVADAAELVHCYQSADVFVLPSRREGLPMALLEAMAFGLPVVTTPVGGIPDVVEDGRTGIIVEPGDVVGLVAAIERLASDPDRRLELGLAARARALGLASPGTIARQWRELYAQHVANVAAGFVGGARNDVTSEG